VGSRFAASGALDIKKIAAEAEVDAILTGTLLSDGARIQVNAQLVAATDGELLWSSALKMPIENIFQLQDELVDRVVQSLAIPMTSSEQHALKHDVPASALAYELYLRASQLAPGYGKDTLLARDLCRRSVEADPRYAPAWACLGRIHRIIGKYALGDLGENLALAEEAFQKAFSLNPNLAVAHNYYTGLQTDRGRGLEAVERLLGRARAHQHDPNLFAGLVLACRYSGLLDASVAAHRIARRLDPNIRTTVPYSYFCLGEYARAMESCLPGGDEFVKSASLAALGRKAEAIAVLNEIEKFTSEVPQDYFYLKSLVASLEGDSDRSRKALDQALTLEGPIIRDAEGCFWFARSLADLNESERALDLVSRALDLGFRCHHALLLDPSLERLRAHTSFDTLLQRAAALDLEAQEGFRAAGGSELLGL
jgi:tetratricopeptide (TPR) repeat protein